MKTTRTTGAGSASAELIPVRLEFDGGSRGNPGPGYGSYRLTINGQPQVVRRVELGPHVTNNEAEYDTLLRALEELLRRVRDPRRIRLAIIGDSELLIKQLRGEYRVRAPGLQPRAARARELLERFGAWEAHWRARQGSVDLFGH
ncbi:reverse transcriptase-like protein [Kallotenue papyrolyticum]|uniref:reverse transcriptase-like protein n=1 Tax=Kallotenue papyrolyticum TaxID=1325125 RepID=UPI00047865AF|nr:reverse transcriptase-like protein [Kallotenue papyrolyticum]